MGAVLIWGQGIFPRGARQQRSSSVGASARWFHFQASWYHTHHPGDGGRCCQCRSATFHTEFLIQILCYGLRIHNSRKPPAGAATAGDHVETSICKYEWCASLQWRTHTEMTKLWLVVKFLSWHRTSLLLRKTGSLAQTTYLGCPVQSDK